MIQVFGAEETQEYEAALTFRDLIVKRWPDVAVDPVHDIRIIAGAKCHGQYPRDVDIILLANLGPGLRYDTFLPFTRRDGRRQSTGSVEVRSLCLAIEVKDHSPDRVRFVGTEVQVLYRDGWKDASEQNFRQVHSVRGYLEQQRVVPPFVTSLLWLRNVPATDLPPRPHQILGAPLTWELILNVVAQDRSPREQDGRWVLDAEGPAGADFARAAEVFTRVLTPTRLDRQRMERINQRGAELSALMNAVGCKLIILRGRGGTGKTMRLLQLASRLSDERDARVLVLTYNRALVADIRRLLTILGIRDDLTGGTIHIQTVHSFLYHVLSELGTLKVGEVDFLAEYDQLKDDALALLEGGALDAADMERLVASDPATFDWDYIFVDEGQDWPRNERDLLLRLFDYKRIVVADGIDQLVRSPVPASWRGNLRRDELLIESLTASLRMKAGLARFVSAVARHLGLLSTVWEPRLELPGGRAIVLDGSYFANRTLHYRLMRDNAEDGNSPVDMLFCVPPRQGSLPAGAPSPVAAILEQWGFLTWDGTREDVRDGYPTDIDQLRIVQYESCRGLEGWITVSLGLDRLYEQKLATAQIAVPGRPGSLHGDPAGAQHEAARWLMIPLTRAMDTLVIQLDRSHSPVRAALEAAAAEYPESVEWITLR
jgi:hypothetical protein